MPIGTKRAVLNTPSKSVPLTFARSGVAYDPYGATVVANNPRFNTLASKSGILIEESTTNILTSAESQSLSGATTKTVTNGQFYTVKIQGTGGSITLSGAATGTVTAGNSLTVTTSSTSLTLTPTGTCTLVQLEAKAYPTSWVLGGTTRNAETLTIPSSVLNIDTQGTVNLLTSGVSNSLSSGTPYTTGTLVAGVAYTFSCGTGSYVLSGGASGTVTPSNPITVTPGAVTVTMTGTSTYNQLEPRSSATGWILGGTQRNTGAGTIEMEVYISNLWITQTNDRTFIKFEAQTGKYYNVFRFHTNAGNSFPSFYGTSTGVSIWAIAGLTSGWNRISISWNSSTLDMFINGVKQTGHSLSNPFLFFDNPNPITIGCYDTSMQMDSLIRNVCISKVKRTDTDIANRASINIYPLDNAVSAFALLESDLKGVSNV